MESRLQRLLRPVLLFLLLILSSMAACGTDAPGPAAGTGGSTPLTNFSFKVGLPDGSETQDGRLLVFLSKLEDGEPRFQTGTGPEGQQVFGIDVEGWAAGEDAVVGGGVFGFPLSDLSLVPAGEYTVQAFLNQYERYERGDGHTVLLPPERGDGQQWARKPGNLYSTPQRMRIDPTSSGSVSLTLDQVIPAIEGPESTEFIKHVQMRSELLSEFWGRDIYLGAHVLLPAGFDEHPEARYPLAVFHGHFPADFGGFRVEPPDADLECEYSARFDLDCYNRTVQEEAHDLYREWISPNFPRMLVVQIQHANPYYDDSYAVNSENIGPYGDAITYELLPFIEEKFRGLGTGWSRFLYGGSTGGWEAMAAQVLYPDDYNGAFVACPDPIDFRAFTVLDLYGEPNAYAIQKDWGQTDRPGRRDFLGHVSSTMEQDNHLELVLGTKGRSGQQWDVWQAVYSPVGEDGYPKPIWDKFTGEIDHDVAEFWRENYDLVHILKRDWQTLGPKLEGKLHIYVGDMDNYYLNNAVYLAEEFLESTTNPYYGGLIDYGDRAEHCWNGDHTRSNALSRLRYVRMYVDRIVERMEEAAPDGADLTSWRY